MIKRRNDTGGGSSPPRSIGYNGMALRRRAVAERDEAQRVELERLARALIICAKLAARQRR